MAKPAIKIEITGIDSVNQFLKDKGSEAFKNAEKAIKDATMFLEGEVKSSIAGQRAEPRSVDTSKFLNTTTSRSNELDGIVEAGVDYSEFLEYGTGKMIERRHFRNSKERNEDKIKEFIEKAIAKISS